MALGGNALGPSGAHSTITHPFRHSRERLAPAVDLDGRRLRLPGTLVATPPGGASRGASARPA